MTKTLIGIGNAGIDITASVESDEQLKQLGFTDKGGCTFPDFDGAKYLFDNLKYPLYIPGGVAANVMCTYSALGGQGRFIGKTAQDDMGHLFRKSMSDAGVAFDTEPCGDGVLSTLIFTAITPDGERSFASYYGASHHISPNDVKEEWLTPETTVLIDSYMLMSDGGEKTLNHIADLAQKNGAQIVFMPCSLSVVRQRWDQMQPLQNKANAIIANQEEALALAEKETVEETIAVLQDRFDWGVVTLSAEGAMYFEKGKKPFHQPAPAQSFTIKNTNGAGDNFAGGFLFGINNDMNVATSLQLGQLCAIEALQSDGARPTGTLKHLLEKAHAA